MAEEIQGILFCIRTNPLDSEDTSTPRKKLRGPKSLIANSERIAWIR
jgi:hypothetical protein